ncbi:acetyl-CoA hydrolase [Desulfitobacterium dichloroeliminans LMG P-21439]|uniref:Acetyl-CoA hydrolase n=1 Tax=Desulfitobacterium dichloroeliminans (strain LMG P-21439 / DCA1) TaxID=871963 RepID=L0F5D7_DESDL|nr:acetyl-CoA hydrolase/transferase C-terminal domain-containing protein [Desulfitobacterium dichloroeliminans]AGA68255.1 acetyl-CoA hydrolase [Desulfitobacterium dichloroeliminans LMG P-21439]
MDVKSVYQSKLTTAAEAAKLIKSGDRVYVAPFTGIPIDILNAIVDRYEELDNVRLTGIFMTKPMPFLTDPKYLGHLEYCTYFVMPPVERAVAPYGLMEHSSVDFSKTLHFLKKVRKVKKLIAGVSTMDEEGYMYFGPHASSVNGAVADGAEQIIVQVNRNMPKIKGEDVKIHVSQVDCIIEADYPIFSVPESEITELDQKIADYIIPLVRDGSTIQVGIGGLANAVSYGLQKRKNLRIYTEMISESMRRLIEVGAVDPNSKAIAGFVYGSNELYDWCANNEQIYLRQTNKTAQVNEIAKNDDFVSINTCLMVDLTGQVASEAVGTRVVAGMGGSSVYVRGATQAKGGQSFICLPSTSEVDGKLTSNIVFSFPPATPVTVQRSDVMNIVTEYGIADLYTQSVRERAKRLIAIAHPDFREELTAQAKAAKYIL